MRSAGFAVLTFAALNIDSLHSQPELDRQNDPQDVALGGMSVDVARHRPRLKSLIRQNCEMARDDLGQRASSGRECHAMRR